MLERLRDGHFGVRVAVWIVVAVALTAIATGIVAILTNPTLQASGIWRELQSISEFSGTVLGFALLVAAWGMRRGYRLAYVVAGALIVLSAVHGVVQSRLLSVPLVVLSVGGLLVLVLTSGRFTRSTALTATQLGTLVAIVGVLCYGTAGAYALRTQFADLHTVTDAFYFTIVTASTVGYGDVYPTTEGARAFTISLVVLGPATVGVAVGTLIGPAIERRFSRAGHRARTPRASERDNRIVVLGYDETTAPLVADLEGHADLLVVTASDEAISTLESRGVDVVDGDPTDESVVSRLDLDGADAILVATGDDAQNSYAVIAVRELTDTRIIVLTTDGRADALEKIGADVAIDPSELLVDAVAGATLEGNESQSTASAASHNG